MQKQFVDGDVQEIKRSDQPSMWDGYQYGRPGAYTEYFDDFTFNPVAADWTITAAGGGTTALAATAPCLGGVLRVTTANADDDLVSIQRIGHFVVPTAGTTIYFEARMQASEATQMDWFVGLMLTDTTPLASADSIVFQKDDGVTTISFKTTVTGGTANTDANVGTFAATTYVKLGFKVIGTSSVEYWVNDVKKGTFNSSIPSVPLRVTLGHQDGDTGAALGALVSNWDYVYVAQTKA